MGLISSFTVFSRTVILLTKVDFKVFGYNNEQLEAFNKWLALPCSANFFVFFKTLDYVKKYAKAENQLYRFDGTVWTQNSLREQFSDDCMALFNYLISNAEGYEKDLPFQRLIDKSYKEVTEMASNKHFVMLQKLPPLEKSNIYFDSNLALLPFRNGVFDLVERSFREHRPTDYLTKTLNYYYNPTVSKQELLIFLIK